MESDELLEHLQQMEEEIQILELENMLLQSYSERNLTHGEELDDKVAKKQSRRSAKKEKVPVELSVSQRTNIALEVNETVKSEIDECKNISEKLVDDLRALLELADVNITDVSKETYEFKRDVQNMSVPGKSANDRLLHHLEEKLRSKDSAIDKLSLKNNALKQQILKLGNQLQHKEEMGEVLHVIDFDQLKIENQQFLEKIEERNNELLKLKLTTGNITQTLNGSKKKLQRLILESETLKKMIVEKKELTKKVQQEIKGIETERSKVQKANSFLKKQIEESAMPEPLEYVQQKATAYQLQKDVANYERKVEIAEMEHRSLQVKNRSTRGNTTTLFNQ